MRPRRTSVTVEGVGDLDPGERAILITELGRLSTAVGGAVEKVGGLERAFDARMQLLEARIGLHDRADTERHADLLRRLGIVEDDVETTAQREISATVKKAAELEAEQRGGVQKIRADEAAEARERKKRRWEFIEKVAVMFLGAIVLMASTWTAKYLGLEPLPAKKGEHAVGVVLP